MSLKPIKIVPGTPAWTSKEPSDAATRGAQSDSDASLESASTIRVAIESPAHLQIGGHDGRSDAGSLGLGIHAPPPVFHPSLMRYVPYLYEGEEEQDRKDQEQNGGEKLSRPEMAARKESTTLGLIVDTETEVEEDDPAVQFAQHGTPTRAHFVTLSPRKVPEWQSSSPPAQKDLLDPQDMREEKSGLQKPLLPEIKVDTNAKPLPEENAQSPFHAFSPLVITPQREGFELHWHHDDHVSMLDSEGGSVKKKEIREGMTSSLADIMGRVAESAKRNRFADN